MGLVVQKYGGSSVADAESIKRVAAAHRRDQEGRQRRRRRRLRDGRHHRRADRPRRAGLPAARRRASSTCCSPRASASRWRCSRWRSTTSASRRARSPARRPASSPTRRTARRGSSTSRPAASSEALDEGAIADRRRLPGRRPGHQGHHHARPRRLGHHRRRARRRARRRRLRDLHRRRRRLHRRPAHRARAPASSPRITYEEMLELAASGAKVLHLRCVEYARRYDLPIHVRSSFSPTRRHVRGHRSIRTKETTVEQPIIAGVAHDRSEAKITVVGVPDKPGRGRRDLPRRSPTPRSTST